MDISKHFATRGLRPEEVRLLEQMLHSGVADRERYLAQLPDAKVEILENDPSLLFVHPPTGMTGAALCEAEYTDEDGVLCGLSLRAVGPYLHELDFYKFDPSLLKKYPSPEELDVYWPAEKGKKGWWEK